MRSDQPIDLVQLLRDADPVTRREFIKRASLAGLSLTAIGQLLAACGGAPAGQAPAPAPASGGSAPPPAASPAAASIPTPAPAVQPAAPSPGASPSPAAAVASGGRKPRRGGTYTTMGHQDVTSLSPDDVGPSVFTAVIGNIHEGLLKIDENYQLALQLAENYTTSQDGKTWTFKLRPNVKWHDGQPFTSADVKYTYEWIMDPANASLRQPLFREVQKVEAPDPLTVVVTLSQPSAPFAALTATELIKPKHVHEKIGEKAYKEAPVGTGPYKLKEFKPNQYQLLEAFDDYWGGRPYIDFWRQNIVPEVSVRAIALRTGEADSSTWPLSPEDNLRFIEDRNFKVYRAPGTAVNHFPTNNQKPLFQDKRVRQAMMHAINREALVKDLMKGLAVVAVSTYTPAVQFYHEPNVKQYPYDPERAKALLAEAGWKPGADGILTNDKGEKFTFNCIVFPGDALRRSEAEVVQQGFRAVGIDMQLREVEPTTALNSARQGQYDMALWNWTYGDVDPDARTTLGSDGANNFSQWKNAEADRLLAAGAAEVDPQKRKQIYSDLQKLTAEEVPFLYIMFWEAVMVMSRRIKGIPENAMFSERLHREVHRFWIEEE